MTGPDDRRALGVAPPLMLSMQQAAEYVGVSVDVFTDEVAAGLWPPAIRRGAKGGRLTWYRPALEAAAAALAASATHGRPEPKPPPPDAPVPDEAPLGLSAEHLSIVERLKSAKTQDRPQRRHKAAA